MQHVGMRYSRDSLESGLLLVDLDPLLETPHWKREGMRGC
jgi:hypothetical protein